MNGDKVFAWSQQLQRWNSPRFRTARTRKSNHLHSIRLEAGVVKGLFYASDKLGRMLAIKQPGVISVRVVGSMLRFIVNASAVAWIRITPTARGQCCCKEFLFISFFFYRENSEWNSQNATKLCFIRSCERSDRNIPR